MSPNEEAYQRLMTDAKTQFGFEPEQVKEILKQHRYSGFRPSLYDVYMAILRSDWIQMDEERIQKEKDKVGKLKEIPYEPIPCPVCGAPTVGDLLWKWTCKKGGRKHSLWARANEIRVNQGLEPLPWSAFENATDPGPSILCASELR